MATRSSSKKQPSFPRLSPSAHLGSVPEIQSLQVDTVLPLSIASLQKQAHNAMVHIDLVPAT
ncbi:hypothetical protein KXX49_007338 [Aspergillus fumigatus]|nr:hypothetical protein KXX49_007338 [Aspergillus fumigatus]